MRKAEIERRLEEIEVRRFIDTPVKHYSSWMYVRLAFALGAIRDVAG
jgi:lipopolysaccharide transport system ATP-binding protein